MRDEEANLYTAKGFNFVGLKFCDFHRSVFQDGLNFTDKLLHMYELIPHKHFELHFAMVLFS